MADPDPAPDDLIDYIRHQTSYSIKRYREDKIRRYMESWDVTT